MRPTLRQLQYLIAIADTGRFGDAAKRLNVSQPSLSAQISEMEAELQCSLTERGRHGAHLTPTGEEVVRRARMIVSDVEDLKALAKENQMGLAGRLKLGILPSIGPYLLPTATKRLHAQFPNLRFLVQEEKTIDLEADLISGKLDVIISTPEDHIQHHAAALFEETLWTCAAPEDPLSRTSGPVKLASLKGRPLLSVGSGHRLSQIAAEVARKAGAFVSEDYQGTSLDAIRQMAVMGAGVALLPSLYVKLEAHRDKEIILRPIQDKTAMRTISLIWRKKSPLTNKFKVLAEVFEATAKELLA